MPESAPGALAPRAPQNAAATANLLIIIPCLNEAAHLDALLAQLVADPGAARARIAIVDGGSHDRSREIARVWAKRDRRVFDLDNPKRIQAAAINRAFEALGADIDFVLRVDAHCAYPADFCARILDAQRQSGADCVTVAMYAEAFGEGWFEHANAAAQNSRLGTGGAPHRHGGPTRRFVEHGHHALMRASLFARAGGYDESFSHNEDAELDARFCALGGRILLASDIVITYYPRAQARGLWRQYFNFGRGRARTHRRHRQKLQWRQSLPLAVAPALLAAPLGLLHPLLAAPALAWAGLCLLAGFALGLARRDPRALGAGLAAMIMHAAWSFGYWRGMLAFRH